ncbi:MAG: hypothetical protein QM638_07785 [Nocardioides sp.]|uniref:hypothetical protein n=1 Tax=Nocardioides sp. TaxID=35761 RepID=UPI0039E4127C
MIGDRWGVTDAEIALEYPCDALVPDAAVQAWRGVSVGASPAEIWPWIVQIRLAPYSYDWIDNLGRRSPRELRGLPDPEIGDPFSATAGRRIGRVVAVEHAISLTALIGGFHMSYLLVPDGASTRLLLKIVRAKGGRYADAVVLGDLVMARRQLLNLKRLSEQHRGRPRPS